MTEEDIRLPQVPAVVPADDEDVAWALSTAEAMWARGDHSEGIKWIRKAAESAADADDDDRALHLAKAASDLAAMLARRSVASTPQLPSPSSPRAIPAARSSTSSVAKSSTSSVAKSSTSSVAKSSTSSVAKSSTGSVARAPSPPATPSRPGFPAPSRVGAAAGAGAPPLGTTPRPGSVAQRPLTPKSVAGPAQAYVPTPEPAPSPNPSTRQVRPGTQRFDSEATMIGQVQSYVGPGGPLPPIEEDEDGEDAWTSAGTVDSLTGYPDRPTTHEARSVSMRPAMASVPRHDPEILTSQAVRVVVWRDANGVHVAPAGTVVSAITVDAVLVALEPNADLTAWLSIRQR